MNKVYVKLFLFLVVVLCMVGSASALQIIPDLYGFGTETRAAYGAANDPEICIVDSLGTSSGNPDWNSAYGPNNIGVFNGTLIQCMEGLDTLNGETIDGHVVLANSGKIILFETSGTINQTGVDGETQPYTYSLDNYTTIAGQTSPNPGILLRNILIYAPATHDILIQHIRGRMAGPPSLPYGNHKSFNFVNTYNVVVDHVSAAWGGDVQMAFWYNGNPGTVLENVTLSNSIIAEPRENIGLVDEEADHGKGFMLKSPVASIYPRNVLLLSNVFMNTQYRAPELVDCEALVVNNYCYNNKLYSLRTRATEGAGNWSLVGNVIKGGPMSGAAASDWVTSTGTVNWTSPVSQHSLYTYDNKCDAGTQTSSSDWSYVRVRALNEILTDDGPNYPNVKVTGEDPVNDSPIWSTGVTYSPIEDVKDNIIENVGAYPAFRDSLDTRFIANITDDTGRSSMAQGPPDVGDWPTLDVNTTILDIPANPHVDSGNGYTNLEVWLHDLADEVEGDGESESAPTTSDFTYHKIITLNQTMVNQSIGTGTYPLLVSTTDTDLRDHCQADGDDIVFFDSDNTSLLPYEQELWNSTTGELVEWVGIEDAINVSYIVMYYNNSTIANSENATGVWDSNYIMVQHLNETPAGTTYDSTSNNNDATTAGMDSADQVTGQIDGSLNFDGVDHMVNITNDAATMGFLNTSGTIDLWFESGIQPYIYSFAFSHRDTAENNRLYLYVHNGTNDFTCGFGDSITAMSSDNNVENDGNTHHGAMTWNATHAQCYLDGDLIDSYAYSISTIDHTVVLGHFIGSYLFNGTIDEVRNSDVNRSHAYVETTYNNTAYPALFISVGTEQPEPNVAPVITLLSSPTPLYQNTTGYFNMSWGITHDSTGLNNSSITMTYLLYDVANDRYNNSLRYPSNDRAAYCSECAIDILRADNRNNSLNLESNTTIFEGGIGKWAGADENTSRFTIVPVNDTYTKIHWNGTAQDTLWPGSWYIDRTEQENATMTAHEIHKTSGVLLQHVVPGCGVGQLNQILDMYIDSYDGGIDPVKPVRIIYLNNSYDPLGAVDPVDSPYAFIVTSLNSSQWFTDDYVVHNSSYTNSIRINTSAISAAGITPTPKFYVYLDTEESSAKPFYFNKTNVATSTNVSFADTGVMWTGTGAPFTPHSYTPNVFFISRSNDSQFKTNLYAQDNNDLWGNAGIQTTNVELSNFAPTNPTINHFHVSGADDYDMNGTYHGTIQVGCGVSSDPDGGAVTHNLTLHYGNQTLVAIINNTFTDSDITHGIYSDIDFNTTTYYSDTDNYTLRLIATDDESESVTVWLPVNFSLSDTNLDNFTFTNATITPGAIREGEPFTVSVDINDSDGTIANAIVKINGGNYSMVNTVNDTWAYIFTETSIPTRYEIDNFYAQDDFGAWNNTTSSLYIDALPSTGSGASGGAATIVTPTPTPTPTDNVTVNETIEPSTNISEIVERLVSDDIIKIFKVNFGLNTQIYNESIFVGENIQRCEFVSGVIESCDVDDEFITIAISYKPDGMIYRHSDSITIYENGASQYIEVDIYVINLTNPAGLILFGIVLTGSIYYRRRKNDS